MDEELRRIDEEIRRASEKKQRLLEKKNQRLKQIRIRRQKDRDEWTKRLQSGLHPVLQKLFGDDYWYRITQQQIYDALAESDFARDFMKDNSDEICEFADKTDDQISETDQTETQDEDQLGGRI